MCPESVFEISHGKLDEKMSNVKKKMKIRQGHRAYLTKILGMANKTVHNYDESQEKKLKQIRITLQERLDILKTLDG